MNWLQDSWPWYVSGPLIGLTVPALYILGGKAFGISTSLQHIGSACLPKSRLAYLRDNDWRGDVWNLVFVAGILVGAAVAAGLSHGAPARLLPEEFGSPSGLARLAIGGVLVGFGTRYADGCTSGHTLTGISNLNWPSLLATVFFFAGGLLMTAILGGGGRP